MKIEILAAQVGHDEVDIGGLVWEGRRDRGIGAALAQANAAIAQWLAEQGGERRAAARRSGEIRGAPAGRQLGQQRRRQKLAVTSPVTPDAATAATAIPLQPERARPPTVVTKPNPAQIACIPATAGVRSNSP